VVVGKALEGRDRLMKHGERRPWVLKREATEPADGRSLIDRGVGCAKKEAHAQGIVEVDRRELGGCSPDERELPDLEGPPKARVETPYDRRRTYVRKSNGGAAN
jgi:hypothetical protein